jgi:hypothetical protein
MAHIGQEFGLGAGGGLGLMAGFAGFLFGVLMALTSTITPIRPPGLLS